MESATYSINRDDNTNPKILVRDSGAVMLGDLLIGRWRFIDGWALGHAAGTRN